MGQENQQRKKSIQKLLAIGGVLFCSLAGTYWVWHATQKQSQATRQQIFHEEAEEIAENINEQFLGFSYTLDSLRRFFLASNFVSQEAWNTFTAINNTNNTNNKNFAIVDIAFIELVEHADLENWLTKIHNAGQPNFKSQTHLQEDHSSSSYNHYIIRYLSHIQTTASILELGSDISEDENLYQTAISAIKYNRLAMSKPFQTSPSSPLYYTTIFLPIYKKNLPVQSVTQRQKAIKGFAYLTLSLQNIIPLTWEKQWASMDIRILDLNQKNNVAGINRSPIIYDYSPQNKLNPLNANSRSLTNNLDLKNKRLFYQIQVNFGNQRWLLIITTPKDVFMKLNTSWRILILGILMSFLLSGFVWTLFRTKLLANNLTSEMAHSLKDYKDRLEMALTASQTGVWRWHIPTGELTWDARMHDIFGTVEALSKNHFDDFRKQIHTNDLSFVSDQYYQAIDSHTELDIEYRIITEQNKTKMIGVRGRTFYDANDRPLHMIGVCWDMTTQKEVESKLRESEHRFELAVNGSSNGLWDLDIKSGRCWFSPQFKAMLGFNENQFPNTIGAWTSRIHSDDLPRVMNMINTHLGYGRPFDIEYRMRTKNATYHWFRSQGKAIQTDNEIKTRITGSTSNITALKQREIELRRSKEFLSQTQKVGCIGGWEYNIRSQEFIWTQEAYIVHHLPRNHLPTLEELTNLYIPAARASIRQSFDLAIKEGKSFDIELPLITVHSKHTWIRVVGEAIHENGAITRIAGVFQDITTQKMNEEKLQNTRSAAEAANQAKSEFLANMSHEIRTPMTAILGYADLLVESDCSNDERCKHAKTIKENGDHLLAIINDILDLSKIESGNLQVEQIKTPILNIIQDVQQLMHLRLKERNLEILIQHDYPLPTTIISDPLRVKQVLVNIISNAIKFTELGGVKIIASIKKLNATTSKFQVEMIDTGIGMTTEQQTRIFRPFGQADSSTTRRFGGSGLGLIISKRIAQALGGDITVTSKLNKGSHFTFTFNVGDIADRSLIHNAEELATYLATNTSDIKESPEQKKQPCRILLAEDVLVNRKIAKRILETTGATIDTVENGQQAYDATMQAMEKNNPYQLIFMDMQMPIMDGYTATAELRKDGCIIPIIALTANAMPEDRKKCLDVGCTEYATKPFNRKQLMTLVENLRGKTHAELTLID